MNKEKEIEKLKKEAKKHLLAYIKVVNEYDCGISLIENISSTVVHHKEEFNKIMDKLAVIDPAAPDFRL